MHRHINFTTVAQFDILLPFIIIQHTHIDNVHFTVALFYVRRVIAFLLN
jgi:hypothetical protein